MDATKLIFLVPYAHLDTQWRWEYPTTINKYLKNTLDENLRLFGAYPGHRFNFTGALRYAMMKEYYPEKFEELRRLVAAGAWHPSGTCLDETDALVPSVESMVRNILYGHRWAMKELGRSSRDYMIPDCFGFPANMPTVMAHCGVSGFSSAKLTWGSAVGIPFEIGIWRGPDGSEIVSALNPCTYDSHLDLPIFLNPARLGRLNRLGRKNGVWKSFQYYGVGDIGGAPTEGSVKRALASIAHYARKGESLSVRQGSSDEFFALLTEDEKKRMDRYEGDFLLTNHSAGTLSSAAVMKRWNRKNEQLAFAAEAAAAAASLLAGSPYPSGKIESAWKRVIGSQMHDILPGTSTPTAYEYAHNDEVVALNTWTAILRDAAEDLAPLIPGEGGILLCNPAPEPRRDAVDIRLPRWTGGEGLSALVRSAAGEEIPAQVAQASDGSFTATFVPELPALGWTRISIVPSADSSGEAAGDAARPGTARPGGRLPALLDPVRLERREGRYVLENAAYRLSLTETGCLESILRKDRGKELLRRPLAYELQRERPFEFPSWNMDWRDRKRAARHRIEGGGAVRVLEEGAIRTTLEVRIRFKSSLFTREISLASGSESVDFLERIEWRESGYSLKLALSADLEEPKVTSNWESSRMGRAVNTPATFEFPSRNWIDISGEDGGISILEDSKYGYDRPAADTLRMTLVYTPAIWYINGFWDQKSHDWGSHCVRYAIRGHGGSWKDTDSLARRFNQPIQAFSLTEASRSRPAAPRQPSARGEEQRPGAPAETAGRKHAFSLVTLSNPQLGILAVKQAEEGEGIIVRLYERHGIEGDGVLSFPFPILSAQEVNGLEESLGGLPARDCSFSVRLPANAIRAYRVRLDAPKKAGRRQEAVPLPADVRLAGRKGEGGSALIPAELLPSELDSGSVAYRLEAAGGPDALRCAGQRVGIPAGYDRLSILLGSREACQACFTWLAREGRPLGRETRQVPALTGFLGQWDRRVWKREPRHFLENRRDYAWINRCTGVEPGYVSRERLEWYSTHTREDGVDQAYRYAYLHSLEFEIPGEATDLVLPDDPRIHIMAMSVSERPLAARAIRKLHDTYDF